MKWAMVLVGILVLSMCSSSESVDTTTAEDAEITATSTSTSASTTTTTILGGGGLPTTEPPTDVPDLSGAWQGTKVVGGQTEEGTVLISQTGMTFTLEFSDGFSCRPADACEFDGTVGMLSDPDSGDLTYVWMASNAGSVGDDGGTYESSFGIQSFSDSYPEGDDSELPASVDLLTGGDVDTSDYYVGFGDSTFRGDGEEMGWETYLLLQR